MCGSIHVVVDLGAHPFNESIDAQGEEGKAEEPEGGGGGIGDKMAEMVKVR